MTKRKLWKATVRMKKPYKDTFAFKPTKEDVLTTMMDGQMHDIRNIEAYFDIKIEAMDVEVSQVAKAHDTNLLESKDSINR